jgi:hypothetical protein
MKTMPRENQGYFSKIAMESKNAKVPSSQGFLIPT